MPWDKSIDHLIMERDDEDGRDGSLITGEKGANALGDLLGNTRGASKDIIGIGGKGSSSGGLDPSAIIGSTRANKSKKGGKSKARKRKHKRYHPYI